MTELSDEELVEQIRKVASADSRLFGELVVRHQQRVLANCRYLTRSADDAEDLAQEVFAKAFFALPKFQARSTFKTWLQRIKINHCLNYNQKKKGRIHVDVDEPALWSEEQLQIAPQAVDRIKAMTQRERLALILDRMNDTLRVPLVLREVDGYSYQEIADQLGVGLSAVKMRIKRARETFREQWEELDRQTGSAR